MPANYQNSYICWILFQVNTWNSGCMNFGMILAFTVHAVLEGLVIGIQDTEYGVSILVH